MIIDNQMEKEIENLMGTRVIYGNGGLSLYGNYQAFYHNCMFFGLSRRELGVGHFKLDFCPVL